MATLFILPIHVLFLRERDKAIGGVLETELARRCDKGQSHEILYTEFVNQKRRI